MKSKASGSIVGGTYEYDMAELLPPPPSSHPEITELWNMFGHVSQKGHRATSPVDAEIAEKAASRPLRLGLFPGLVACCNTHRLQKNALRL